MTGQNIFIFILLGALVVGFVYLTFIRPKQTNTSEEPKVEEKPESKPTSSTSPKKSKKK